MNRRIFQKPDITKLLTPSIKKRSLLVQKKKSPLMQAIIERLKKKKYQGTKLVFPINLKDKKSFALYMKLAPR